jgi:hypothetical protein
MDLGAFPQVECQVTSNLAIDHDVASCRPPGRRRLPYTSLPSKVAILDDLAVRYQAAYDLVVTLDAQFLLGLVACVLLAGCSAGEPLCGPCVSTNEVLIFESAELLNRGRSYDVCTDIAPCQTYPWQRPRATDAGRDPESFAFNSAYFRPSTGTRESLARWTGTGVRVTLRDHTGSVIARGTATFEYVESPPNSCECPKNRARIELVRR